MAPVAPAFELTTRDGALYANGERIRLKGANWFGSEAYNGPPNGLQHHTADFYLDFLASHRFNALRLLFNHEQVLKDEIVDAPEGAAFLFQTRYVDMFRAIARKAAARGMLVMIGCHRVRADAWPGKGLWYDDALGYPESRVKQSWSRVAAALCGEWNVVLADLANEPHASSWGKGLAVDWNLGAARLGDHVLDACPRWAVAVEGVGYDPGAPGGDDPGAGFWWGENLVGVHVAPVKLQRPNKLVYSPHVYGPSVYMQKYFLERSFPGNMPAVWQQHFAFAQRETGVPIVIGEIGGRYTDRDRQWQDWALTYAAEQGFSLFYFALNPDSEDTGGLLKAGWELPEEGDAEADKLAALAKLPSTDIFAVCPSCLAAVNASAADGLPSGPPPAPSAALLLLVLGGIVAALAWRHRRALRAALARLQQPAKRGKKAMKHHRLDAPPPKAAEPRRAKRSGKAKSGRRRSEAAEVPVEAPVVLVEEEEEAAPVEVPPLILEEEDEMEALTLRRGGLARVHGLVGAPQYNGKIVRLLARSKGRWKASANGKGLSVLEANLTPIDGAAVEEVEPPPKPILLLA